MSIERAEADLARARSDLERLRAQVRVAESRVLKIEHYLEVARAYDAPEAVEIPRSRNGGPPLVQASIEIIRERGSRQQTRHLVEELERRGHHIGGSNKVTNLSGALSRSPILSSNRLEGWGLKEWGTQGQPEPLEDAADDDLGPFVPPAEVPLSIGEDDIPF